MSGTVLDKTRLPITDAVVHILETKQIQITDANGYFVFKGIRAGHYHLHVEHIGYSGKSIELSLRSDSNLIIMLQASLHTLDEVTVESDPLKQDNKGNSLITTKVTEQDIIRHAAGSLTQTLAQIPGVQSMNMGVSIGKPMIRGLSFNRVLVLDNGVKQEGQQWGSDHGLEIDQYGAEGIEILKGPAALLYGSDAMGGVVSISKPLHLPVGKIEAMIQPMYRSVNQTIALTTMAKGNNYGKVWKIHLTGLSSGDYQVPAQSFTYTNYRLRIEDGMLKNTAGMEQHAYLVLGLQKNWGYSHLVFSTYNQKQGMFAGAIGIPRNYTLRSDGNRRNIDLPYQYIRHQKIISNSNIKLGSGWIETDLGFQWNDRSEYSKHEAHGQIPRSSSDLAVGLDLYSLSAHTRYHNSIAKNWDGLIGVQWQYQWQKTSGFEHLIPKFRQQQTGIFLIQKYIFSERLAFNGGIRFDLNQMSVEQAMVPVYDPFSGLIINQGLRNGSFYKDFHNVSVAIGTAYDLLEWLHLKINLSRDFRFPTVQELSVNGVHHGTFRHEKGDSTLQTEIGYQSDLGLFAELGKVHISITPFYNYFNKYIYLSPTSRFSNLPEGGQLYTFTQADAVHYGGEVQLEWQLIKSLKWNTHLSYVHGTNLETQLPLPLMPPLSHVSELEYAIKNPFLTPQIPQVSIKWGQHSMASQLRVDRNEKQTPGYSISHFYLTFFIGKKLKSQIVAQLNNAFDVRYMNHLSRWRYLNLPEPGRNINLLYRYTF